MAHTRKYLCGTPTSNCSGGKTATSAWLGRNQKTHNSSPEAFRCYAGFLIALGAERIGSREFRMPANNPLGVSGVLVLAKQSHFGGELRPGKRADKTQSRRFEPKNNQSGLIF